MFSRKLAAFFALTLVLLSTSAASASSIVAPQTPSGGEWTSFTHDYNNTRYNPVSTITSSNVATLKLKWFFSSGFAVTSTPVVLNGSAYFADWGGVVYCVSIPASDSAGTGEPCSGWSQFGVSLSAICKCTMGVSSTLALANGLVYVAGGPFGTLSSPQHQVFALRQSNGSLVWNFDFPDAKMSSIWASPTVYNGLVYIGVAGQDEKVNEERGQLYAINATTGAEVWNYNTTAPDNVGAGAPVIASVVVDPALNSIYFATGNPYNTPKSSSSDIFCSYCVIALDAATGAQKWFYQIYATHLVGHDYDILSTPNLFNVKIGGTLYSAIGVGGKDGNYYVLDRTNGNLLREVAMATAQFPGIAPVISVAGYTYPDGNPSHGNPEVFQGSAYKNLAGKSSGLVSAYNPSSNTFSWQFNTKGPVYGSIAIVPGAVLIGDKKGFVYALSTVDGTKLWSFRLPRLSVLNAGAQIGGGVTVAEGHAFVGNYVKDPEKTDPNLGLYAFAP